MKTCTTIRRSPFATTPLHPRHLALAVGAMPKEKRCGRVLNVMIRCVCDCVQIVDCLLAYGIVPPPVHQLRGWTSDAVSQALLISGSRIGTV